MATTETRHGHHDHHDWHSRAYVKDWIARDTMRDDVRRPLLRQMIEAAPFPRDAAIDLLDVGAGFGAVTEEALRVYPKARPVLQDYSRPMLDEARAHLGEKARYALADLFEPSWAKEVGGPFDLAISGIAIHNLGNRKTIFEVYRAVHGLLKRGGYFLNYDRYPGGVEPHIEALKEAGFRDVKAIWQEGVVASVVAGPRG